jgi:hypothetical protein
MLKKICQWEALKNQLSVCEHKPTREAWFNKKLSLNKDHRCIILIVSMGKSIINAHM